LPDAPVETGVLRQPANRGVGAAQPGDALGSQKSGAHLHPGDGNARPHVSDDAVDPGQAVDQRCGATVVQGVDR